MPPRVDCGVLSASLQILRTSRFVEGWVDWVRPANRSGSRRECSCAVRRCRSARRTSSGIRLERGQRVAVVPRQPLGTSGGDSCGVVLQLCEIVRQIRAAQFAAVDQRSTSCGCLPPVLFRNNFGEKQLRNVSQIDGSDSRLKAGHRENRVHEWGRRARLVGGIRIRPCAPGAPFRDNWDAVRPRSLAVVVLQQAAELAFALDALSTSARCEMVASD